MVRFIGMPRKEHTYSGKRWQLLCVIIILCSNCFAQKPELVVPVGHTDKISTASFSHDSRYIVTGANDRTAIIWEAATGTLIKTLQGHTQAITSANFSADGKNIVTASYDRTIKIWDVATGSVQKTFSDPRDTFYSAAFSPNGKQVVVFTVNNIQIWDVEQATLFNTIDYPGLTLKNVSFSPDAKQVMSVSYDNIKIWDASSAALVHTIPTPGIASAMYSPDGSQVQVVTNDASISLWDVATEKQVRSIYKNKDPRISTAQIARCNQEGKYAAAAFPDNTVKVWDVATGTMLQTLKGHTAVINSMVFSPDGKRMATTANDKTARVWVIATGASLLMKGSVRAQWSACYSPDGKYILAPSRRDSSVSIWSADGTLLRTFRGNTDLVLSAAWSPDSKCFATSCRDNTVKTWNALTGKLLNTFTGHTNLIWNVSYSPDGKYLATASNDNTAKIWDAATGKLLQTLKGHMNWLNTASWSPDGRKVVTASWDGTIKIWTAATGALVKSVDDQNNIIWDASFSPDGKYVMAEDTWTAKVWEAETSVLVHTLQGGKMARFSLDSKYIVTSADDNTAQVWDVANGGLLQTLTGHNGKIRSVGFSPDGKQILTYSEDNTNKVWDAASGKNLFTFFSVSPADYIVFDADNRFDGTAAARKMVYFNCGTEIIALNQVRDQLWIPHLAQRLLNANPVKSKKISELDLCDQLPEIEEVYDPRGLYFRITPHRGGFGEVAVYVNGVEAKRYFAAKLDKPDYYYDLRINKEELRSYLQDGKENKITVRAFTVDNDPASRAVDTYLPSLGGVTPKPTLYAVIIGINDSKDTLNHLKFASKDAADMSAAIKANASKQLGAGSVFTYLLTAGDGHYMLPGKEGISKTLEEIGRKTKPNDILLIYFAGHTAIEPSTGQLYFLTNDAGRISATDPVPGTDISAQELTNWLHPSKMKAQKRVLVLDERNSGLAISNVLVAPDQYDAAHEDEKVLQAKALEKLSERGGFLILAAPGGSPAASESVDAAIKKFMGK